MTRPSRNIDRLLLETGRRVILETGSANLKVRRITSLAKVNLGMFHYYFKTREEFTRQVLQSIYESFFKDFVLETSKEGTPLQRLERALVTLGKFARDNRSLVLMLFKDAIEGNRHSIAFAKANISRHIFIISDLILECQRKRALKKLPVQFVLTYLMGSIGMPSIIVGILEKTSKHETLPVALNNMKNSVLSDSAIGMRVRMALKGLSPS